MTITETESSSPLYAVIDLGSNSFHMLITRQLADSVQVVDKVKRKVRLASGLDENNNLSTPAMERGLTCLGYFAERLKYIAPENVRIVATATLRIAANRAQFFQKAEIILGRKIQLLSGLDEAKQIYLGVAHTSCENNQRLVIDIGGASTEIIVGNGRHIAQAVSLDIGCVTFNQRYFPQGALTFDNFTLAIDAAKQEITKVASAFIDYGWQCAFSGSGTIQALAEMLNFHKQSAIVSLDYLLEIKQQLILAGNLHQVELPGLAAERVPVLASGLSVLIALFQQLHIQQLKLSNGALREGLLYEMLAKPSDNIRHQTINSLIKRFHIDIEHAKQVQQTALHLFQQIEQTKTLTEESEQLLTTSCLLHELGLIVDFKNSAEHGCYLLSNMNLPGFSHTEKQLIAYLIKLQRGEQSFSQVLQQQVELNEDQAITLALILRIAIILCQHRQQTIKANFSYLAASNQFVLQLPLNWLAENSLIADELNNEVNFLTQSQYSQLVIQS